MVGTHLGGHQRSAPRAVHDRHEEAGARGDEERPRLDDRKASVQLGNVIGRLNKVRSQLRLPSLADIAITA